MPAGKSGGEVFYSNSAKALDSPKVPKAANGPAMLNAMIKGGANLQEMKWMGLDQFLMDHKGKVTKDRVQDFIDTNQIQVMEKVRGGNYREPVLKAKREADLAEEDMFAAQERGTPEDFRAAKEKYERLQKEFVMLTKDVGTKHGGGELVLPGAKKGSYRELQLMLPRNKGEKFIGPEAHWGKDENVFASVRFNERTDADGKRMLFIEEVQSDWAAKGREEGFAGGESVSEVQKLAHADRQKFYRGKGNKVSDSEWNALADKIRDWDAREMAAWKNDWTAVGAPPSPFVSKRKGGKHVEDDKWRALAFKRILRWAADEGFSRVGWISGTDTAKRYDLSKTLNSVEWQRMPGSDTVHITTLDKDGKAVISDKPVNINKLKNTIGRELSEKILASDKLSGEFTGLELEVGGEGHKQFYDVDLPNYVRKYVKTWGGEVGKVGIDVGGEKAARDTKGKSTFNTSAHYTDITPSMKKSVGEGQALFMPAGKKGEYKVTLPDGSTQTFSSKRAVTHVGLAKQDGKWLRWSMHSSRESAMRRIASEQKRINDNYRISKKFGRTSQPRIEETRVVEVEPSADKQLRLERDLKKLKRN
jgi:hypothetical protein